ncbi:MAG: hypothetical protein V4760_04240 [Bdellovibrionota bacterium]
MKHLVLTFFALALTTLAIGCSSGSGSGTPAKDNKGAPGPAGQAGADVTLPAGATRPTGLSANPWCNNDNVNNRQMRLVLSANGSAQVQQFAMNAGARGTLQGEKKGSWHVENNSTLAYEMEDWGWNREAIRLDPNGPAGAPQLVFGTAPQTVAYDPCL